MFLKLLLASMRYFLVFKSFSMSNNSDSAMLKSTGTIDQGVFHLDQLIDAQQLHLDSGVSLHRVKVGFSVEFFIDFLREGDALLFGFAVVVEDAPCVMIKILIWAFSRFILRAIMLWDIPNYW